MIVAWPQSELPTLGGGFIFPTPTTSFHRGHMPCLCKSMLGQAFAIVAIGAAIGVADAFSFRPINLKREAPPLLPLITFDPKTTTPPAPVAPPQTAPAPAPAAFKETPKTDFDKPGQITVTEARALFDQQATFLDARKLDPYKLGHVKGAWRLELSDFDAGDPQFLALIPRSSVLVVYCSGGHCDESEAVARMLTGSGYKSTYVMHDGIPGWTALGHPVTTGEERE